MQEKKLQFSADGHFRILMVSDFHAGKDYNPKLKIGLEALLKETNPDFVMIGGDQCLERHDSASCEAYWRDIISPVLDRKLPWATIFGNHDREMGMDIEEEEAVYERIEGCMSSRGPKEIDGVGNYCVPVMSSDGTHVAYNLWALDCYKYQRDLYGKDVVLPHFVFNGQGDNAPTFRQAMWYYMESEKMEKEAGHPIPGVMFTHVPLPEFLYLSNNPEECGVRGSKRDNVGCAEISTGLFAACLDRKDIRGIFFGHEHLNDLQGQYCGVTMACDAALGYNMSCHDDLRGGRVIDLYENGEMGTRMIKLWDIMGEKCMRDPNYFEGGCRYNIRIL